MNETDTRKNMVIKARAHEVKHNLRAILDKEKKHQWYIYHRKNYPYSKDVKNQTLLEKAIDPDVPLSWTQKVSNIPITSMGVGLVGHRVRRPSCVKTH